MVDSGPGPAGGPAVGGGGSGNGSQGPTAGPGRGLRWALAVSLALNVAVVGMVAGAMLRDGPPGRPGVAPRDISFGPYLAVMTPPERAALRAAFVARAPGFRDARLEMRADMVQVAAALRAEPFDRAAVEAALERGTARARGFLELGQSVLSDHLASLTPAERAALADRIEAVARRKPRQGAAP